MPFITGCSEVDEILAKINQLLDQQLSSEQSNGEAEADEENGSSIWFNQFTDEN